MIERIKEENVWDFLKKDGKPVMIYGMGNGAEKIISTLSTYQIQEIRRSHCPNWNKTD